MPESDPLVSEERSDGVHGPALRVTDTANQHMARFLREIPEGGRPRAPALASTVQEPPVGLDGRGLDDGASEDQEPEIRQIDGGELDTVDRRMARLFRDSAAPMRGPMLGDDSPARAGQVSSAVPLVMPIGGRTLGRYLVLGELGSGGMGTVLKAYDESLNRAVAIKLLQCETADRHTKRHTERLRREAQALARLSHPNVVQVYEVGCHEEQWFIAMELVDGRTLRQWRETPRGWRECVEVYLQAGVGLAAAHAAGLVHRDFKPDNCIVDGAGRPRVLDFGLVGGDVVPPLDAISEEVDTIRLGRRVVESSLTESGTVLGTPAYMPPEQMRGEEADARSDQFSFCVSLYEAIYGERPFEGVTMAALRKAVCLGVVRAVPKGGRVPGRLRQILLRGLTADPMQRWSSMDELLAELQRLVMPHRRRSLALSAGLALVGAGLAYQAYRADMRQRCTGARAQMDGIWDDARRRAVEVAIQGSEVSYAADTWARVATQLDAYADAWVGKHTEVCEATKVRHEQPDEAMRLRMRCLGQRRNSLRASVDVLAGADSEVVESAVKLVAGLPRLARCDDLHWLEQQDQRVRPPEDPNVAAEVEALRKRLVDIAAIGKAGRYAEALEQVEPVVQRADVLGYAPLLAEAQYRRGVLQDNNGQYAEAEQDLRRAHTLAVEHHHDEVALHTAQRLTSVVGYQLARHADGRHWGQMAALPLAQRSGDPIELAASLSELGGVLQSQGEFEDAKAHHQRALAIRQKALGVDHPDLASSLNSLGNAYSSQGEYEGARGYYQRALVMLKEALGADHPDVAVSLNNLGNTYSSQGKYEEAKRYHQRALALWERALSADHPSVATSLSNLGVVYIGQGEYEEAKRCYVRVLAIREKALGGEHPQVADGLDNLGNVYNHQGQYEEARWYYERALAIREKALGADHLHVATSLNNLGVVCVSQGEYEEAKQYHQRALAIREAVVGSDHPDVAYSLNNLGNVYAIQGEYEEAKWYYEWALAVVEKVLGADHLEMTYGLNNLGDLYNSQGEYEEARMCHQRALAIREEALGVDHPDVAFSLNNLGNVYSSQGAYEKAEEYYQRALGVWERALGVEHPDLAYSLINLGEVYSSQRKYEKAKGYYRRALQIQGKTQGADHPLVAYSLVGLATVALQTGGSKSARAYAERAVLIREAAKVASEMLAEARFVLARALWSARHERARARALAEQAREALVAAEGLGDAKVDLDEIDAWLATHRVK